MKKPSRKERRLADRTTKAELRVRLKLAALEEGGSTERPIVVASASLVEVTAKAKPCVACGGEVRVDTHEAIQTPSGAMRIAKVVCRVCGGKRELYYRIVQSAMN